MSTHLERDLLSLAASIDWPPTPDLAPRVAASLTDQRGRRRAPRARVVPALVAALVAVAAIPPARAAFKDLLGISGGSRVFRVGDVPKPTQGRIDLGVAVPLDTARALASFTIGLPAALPAPDRVQFSTDVQGGMVTLRFATGDALTELSGEGGPFIEKLLGPGTRARHVVVRGAPGFFLTGDPHLVIVQDASGEIREAVRTRPGANVLLWDAGGVSYRLETTSSLGSALRVARSVR